MLSPIGKPILVTDPGVIAQLRKSVEEGIRLDTSNFNWTPRKSIHELIIQEKQCLEKNLSEP